MTDEEKVLFIIVLTAGLMCLAALFHNARLGFQPTIIPQEITECR